MWKIVRGRKALLFFTGCQLWDFPFGDETAGDTFYKVRTCSRPSSINWLSFQARTVPHKSSTKRKGTDGTKFWNEPTWRCHQNPFIGALGIINLLSLASHK